MVGANVAKFVFALSICSLCQLSNDMYFSIINVCVFTQDGDSPTIVTPDNFNCIPLDETLQLSWRVDNDNSQVNFRLCGCQSLKPG